MVTRKERVILELDSNFARQMAKDAAAAELFKGALHGVSSEAPAFTRTSMTIERDTIRAGSSIDKLSGRLHLLVQSAAALGPALIPVATAVVPAIAGLTTELGFAVAAGGTAVLAFHGVADTLDALNKAQLKPTAENIAKLREEASHLSPAAQELVIQLDKMGPAFRQVRDAAQEGLLPGVSASLDEIESLLPRVASIVGEIGDVTGELLTSGAESLAGPEWEDFFRFIEAEARPTLMQLGLTVGHVTKGLAEMWMAFAPLSHDFTGGLLDASAAFESWAESLSSSDDFRAFVEYIRETGPQVLATLGDIGNMFLQIAEAAAPLGGPTLEIIGSVADVIASIADSDIGTPIMTGVAALSAMNLVMTATGKIGGTAFGGFIKGQVQASTGIKTLRTDLALMRAEYERMGPASAILTSGLSNTTGAADRTRATLGRLGAGAAVAAGGFAVMDDSLGLTNTAMFALMGTVAGPWGAAIGGGVGLVRDFTAGNNDLEAAMRAVNAVAKRTPLDFEARSRAMEDLQTQIQQLRDDTGTIPDALATGLDFLAGPLVSIDDYQDKTREATEASKAFAVETLALQAGVAEFAQSVNRQTGLDGYTTDLASAEDAAKNLIPALQGAGYSIEQIQQILLTHTGWDAAVAAARNYITYQDSAAGRTDHFAEALSALDLELETTKDSAQEFTDALNGLFDPKINLDAAVNDWKQALQSLKDELDTVTIPGTPRKVVPGKAKDIPAVPDREGPGSRSLFDGSEGALKNQDVLRERVKLINDVLAAEAEAGAGPEKIAKMFRDQRDALVDTAVAAGLSKGEVEKYLNKLGLTPKTIRTVLEAVGFDAAGEAADRLNAKLDRLAHPRIIKVTVQAIQSGDRFGVSITDRDGDGKADYDTGGFTGRGGKHEVAGVVHRGEVVIPAEETQRDWGMLKSRYGYLPGFADGGYVSRSVPVSPSVDLRGLAAELAPLIAGLRPIYGDVHMQPHDYKEFKRQMLQDRIMAQSGGVHY